MSRVVLHNYCMHCGDEFALPCVSTRICPDCKLKGHTDGLSCQKCKDEWFDICTGAFNLHKMKNKKMNEEFVAVMQNYTEGLVEILREEYDTGYAADNYQIQTSIHCPACSSKLRFCFIMNVADMAQHQETHGFTCYNCESELEVLIPTFLYLRYRVLLKDKDDE